MSGSRSSRFGPTLPVEPASASVWQPPQFAVNTFLPGGGGTPPPPPGAAPPRPPPRVVVRACSLVAGADSLEDELPPEPPHALTPRATTARQASLTALWGLRERRCITRGAGRRRWSPSGSCPAGTSRR